MMDSPPPWKSLAFRLRLRTGGVLEWAALVAVPLAALLAAACGGGGSPPEEEVPLYFPLTVERADGKELTFERPARRIVSLSPGHTEVLFAIGAGDQVVAVDTESDFPEEAAAKTEFDATSPDLEALEGLDPDLVVVMDGPEEVVQALDQRGLTVLWLELPSFIQDLFTQIDILGEVTAHREQSDSLVDEMDGRVVAILDKVGATEGPRVYHELDDELTSVSLDTFIGELYQILNAENIAGRSEGPLLQLTQDDISAGDPEVIIVAHSGATPESVKDRPGWQNIAAVKNDRVYAVDPDIVNRPGPRLVDGLETLAKLLLPNLFPQP